MDNWMDNFISGKLDLFRQPFDIDKYSCTQITWRDLDTLVDVSGHIYAICDSIGVVVYVGRAASPLVRLGQHIGDGTTYPYLSADEIGRYILSNAPESLAWEIKIYDAPNSNFVEQGFINYFATWFNERGNTSTERKRPTPKVIHDTSVAGITEGLF